ncbi:MAG TPA: Vms1/Ankzf1 family peptidyl-tRNA hydrolase [Blastocatellia bacterium]|nr:Vms1/Ankzf1 family peptidyl-tRNA hydrolase [Blastocatellia bacterium]
MLLDNLLDRLAAFESPEFPVISLYLNTQAGDRGRDQFQPFVRKELHERGQTYKPHSPERTSYDRDVDRINRYLANELEPSANGLAIFACAGKNDFFEAVQLDAPVERNRLFVDARPHLYPLARLVDQYPRYAALVADTNSARLFVFGLGRRISEQEVNSPNVNRTQVGGWSQARFQRHVDNYHQQHAKEVIEALDRVVREENIKYVILAGDEVIVPQLREQLPKHLADKVIDVLALNIRAPEREILNATLESLRERDAQDDKEKVQRMLDAYRADRLAVAGARDTLAALKIGQVDEVILSAAREEVRMNEEVRAAPMAAGMPVTSYTGERTEPTMLADELVTLARQTDAKITFIEDASLLAEVGGVGALLRYRVWPAGQTGQSSIRA